MDLRAGYSGHFDLVKARQAEFLPVEGVAFTFAELNEAMIDRFKRYHLQLKVHQGVAAGPGGAEPGIDSGGAIGLSVPVEAIALADGLEQEQLQRRVFESRLDEQGTAVPAGIDTRSAIDFPAEIETLAGA